MITPPAPPYQGGVQRETLTASRRGVGLSNWVSHSIENRYKDDYLLILKISARPPMVGAG
ncbi:MAG: hypothetical protein ACOYMP_12255 [Nodosilinea sp.]